MAPARTATKRKQPQSAGSPGKKQRGTHRDEELSDDGEAAAFSDHDERRAGGSESEEESGEEEIQETAEEARLRIAKKYLQTVEDEVAKVEAEEDDLEAFNRDAIAHRLQHDVQAARGRAFKRVADTLKDRRIPGTDASTFQRGHKLPLTALALVRDSVAFTASKDGSVLRWDLKAKTKERIFPAEGKVGPAIHAVAASSDGCYAAFGGKDQLVHVWDDKERRLVQSFKGHRGAVSSLAFQQGTRELFSGSQDRTIKIWNLDEMCYVETLFGHQSEIMGLGSLLKERCVSVGRDRTARLWKVVEESQLVFRGHVSSIDTISMLTEELFCAGGEDGAVSLWNVGKKKPTRSAQAAHGRDAGGTANCITAVAGLAHTDLMASGSCDGFIRLWKCGPDHTSLEEIAQIPVIGFVNALAFLPGGRGLAVAVGQEHRLGRWTRIKEAKNGLLQIPLMGEGDESLL